MYCQRVQQQPELSMLPFAVHGMVVFSSTYPRLMFLDSCSSAGSHEVVCHSWVLFQALTIVLTQALRPIAPSGGGSSWRTSPTTSSEAWHGSSWASPTQTPSCTMTSSKCSSRSTPSRSASTHTCPSLCMSAWCVNLSRHGSAELSVHRVAAFSREHASWVS